jgi:hypothetical protein
MMAATKPRRANVWGSVRKGCGESERLQVVMR